MKLQNNTQLSWILGIMSIIVSIFTYNNSHNDGVPTCDNYSLNTYLYVLSMLLTVFFIMSLEIALKANMFIINSAMKLGFWIGLIVILGITILLLKLMLNTNPRQSLLKHSLLLIMLLWLGIISAMSFVYLKDYLLIGIVLTTVIAVIAWKLIQKYETLVSSKTIQYTSYALIGLIFGLILASLYIKNPETRRILLIILLLCVIVVMCIRLLAHNQDIVKNEKLCKEENIYPNYIDEAFGVYIVLQNLIFDIARVARLFRKK
jgi:FtsH-binding integral membrane protein